MTRTEVEVFVFFEQSISPGHVSDGYYGKDPGGVYWANHRGVIRWGDTPDDAAALAVSEGETTGGPYLAVVKFKRWHMCSLMGSGGPRRVRADTLERAIDDAVVDEADVVVHGHGIHLVRRGGKWLEDAPTESDVEPPKPPVEPPETPWLRVALLTCVELARAGCTVPGHEGKNGVEVEVVVSAGGTVSLTAYLTAFDIETARVMVPLAAVPHLLASDLLKRLHTNAVRAREQILVAEKSVLTALGVLADPGKTRSAIAEAIGLKGE